jgi:flagellar P-ring protein precursor FlgI
LLINGVFDVAGQEVRMHTARLPLTLLLWSAMIALGATPAAVFGTTIQDLVRIKGLERNVLTGMGIVIGLNGTGDKSKDSYVAARPYATLLKNLGNPVLGLDELVKADAYAIVEVSMEIPPAGIREGDRVDVSVSTLFNASSLAGGRLIVSLLRAPRPDAPDLEPFAFAEGSIVLEGTNFRTGIVRNGGQMLKDIRTNPVTPSGTMTLVLKDQYAGYPVATMISGAINDEFMVGSTASAVTIAVAEDSKNIRVLVPQADRRTPAQFIANLMTIPIDPSLIQTEARIVINERQGIILVTGNVQIGPVGITHRGLTITSITPPLEPTVDNPSVETSRWTGIDTTDRSSRNSTRLVELLDAFKQLNVPVSDQIAILYELRKTGALHAEIVTQ